MVQYIPGPESVINPAITQIADAVGKFINPLKDMQLGMYQALMQKPELLQSFANMEHTNPGITEKMGLGPVANLIKDVGPDIKTQAEVLYGPKMIQAQGQKIQNELALGSKQAELIGNPETATDIGRVSLGLPTTTEAAIKAHQEVTTAAEAKTAPAEADLKLQQMKTAKDILAKYPNLKNINLLDVARHPDKYPEAFTALMANPASAAAMGEVFQNERQRLYLENQSNMMHYRYTNKDLMGQLTQRRAMEAFVNSGWKGSLDLWQKWISTPAFREKAQQMASGKMPIKTEDDQFAVDMANYAASNQLIKYRAASDAASKSISATMVQISKGDLSKDALGQKIASISSRLAEIKAAGGPDIKIRMAHENPLWPGPSNYPEFYDPKHPDKALDLDTVNALIEDVDPKSFVSKAKEYTPGSESSIPDTTGGGEVSRSSSSTKVSGSVGKINSINDAVDAIASAPDPKAAWERAVSQITDPQTIVAIRSGLVAKGVKIQ